MHVVTRKFRETLVRWQLLRKSNLFKGEKVLVAVSGGIDSMVLLHLLAHLPWKLKLTVLHYNHRLRGRESDEEERFVRAFCREEGISCRVGKAPPWRKKENLQERARELRYRFFWREGKRIGAKKLVTAHQADDQAESFLIRWIQGAGLRGLGGIPLTRKMEEQFAQGGGVVIRPLLFISREEIKDYAKTFGIPFREDPSNQSDRYLRNKVRHLMRNLKRLNPNLPVRSSVNSLFLKADDDYLREEVQKELRLAPRGRYKVSRYQKLHPALRFRLLQQMAGNGTSGLSGDHILKLDELLSSKEGRLRYHLSSGILFRKEKGTFSLSKSPPP